MLDEKKYPLYNFNYRYIIMSNSNIVIKICRTTLIDIIEILVFYSFVKLVVIISVGNVNDVL